MKLSIIIPAYNSRKFLPKLIQKIRRIKLGKIRKEIIVVDDCSPDKTFESVKSFRDVILIRHKKNTGKGGALQTGLSKTTGDILYIQDDDLEYDPKDIPIVIKPIIDEQADVCFSSRHLSHQNKYSSLSYYLGGRLIDLIINLYLGSNINDSLSGSKAFTRKVYEKILPLESQGFEIETEMVAKIVKAKFRIAEVPVHYYPRTHKQGKNIRWHHGFQLLVALWKFG